MARRRKISAAIFRKDAWRAWVKRHPWLTTCLALFSVYIAVLPSGLSYRSSIPSETSLMQIRHAEAAKTGRTLRIEKRWVPLSKISKNVIRAVLVGEDSGFYSHHGIEFGETLKVVWRTLRTFQITRGASTITQQLAKNLYLSESKNPFRKLSEAIIALKMEVCLSKQRILELYMNSIEWGEGIFGIEAAATHYFGTSAAQLSEEQASILAAMIPNPRTVYSLSRNPRRVHARARLIQSQMKDVVMPKE